MPITAQINPPGWGNAPGLKYLMPAGGKPETPVMYFRDIDSLRLYLEDRRERTWSQRWIQGKASVLRTRKSKTRSSLKDR